MCSASLPPWGSQTQWPRVVRVDNIPGTNAPQKHRLLLPWDQIVTGQDVDSNKKMAILEKRLFFLQQQHAETLGKLHQEIEQLRRENKDLHYQLIMNEEQPEKGHSTAASAKNSTQRRCTPEPEVTGPPPPHTPVSVKPESQEQDKTEQGQTQTSSVKMDLKEWPVPPSCGDGSIEEQSLYSTWTKPTGLPIGQSRMPVVSLNPLLVNEAVGHPPRAPTLQECEYLIHQLWSINHTQAQELLHLKTFLKEVVSHNKWAPESDLLAKALLCHSSREQDIIQFPKLPAKGQSEKCIYIMYQPPTQEWGLRKNLHSPTGISVSEHVVHDEDSGNPLLSIRTNITRRMKAPVTSSDKVILPAMKPTLGISPAERLKKSQAMQRNRFRRSVL